MTKLSGLSVTAAFLFGAGQCSPSVRGAAAYLLAERPVALLLLGARERMLFVPVGASDWRR
ncbi:MAG: hypothetical protein A2885_19580 [Sphingopyxis sp. RIFCSPHIGHO2_01_FULL_65_24]|nr:MAG: hypothetical protein A2885_19580 [Sphingopyxis sp. RIFCSPHIGHO2_01_FULL_65_24]